MYSHVVYNSQFLSTHSCFTLPHSLPSPPFPPPHSLCPLTLPPIFTLLPLLSSHPPSPPLLSPTLPSSPLTLPPLYRCLLSCRHHWLVHVLFFAPDLCYPFADAEPQPSSWHSPPKVAEHNMRQQLCSYKYISRVYTRPTGSKSILFTVEPLYKGHYESRLPL